VCGYVREILVASSSKVWRTAIRSLIVEGYDHGILFTLEKFKKLEKIKNFKNKINN
jgi:hypothetical protein